MELCQIEQNARQKACKEKTAETSLPVHKKDSNHSLVRPQVQYRNSDLFQIRVWPLIQLVLGLLGTNKLYSGTNCKGILPYPRPILRRLSVRVPSALSRRLRESPRRNCKESFRILAWDSRREAVLRYIIQALQKVHDLLYSPLRLVNSNLYINN